MPSQDPDRMPHPTVPSAPTAAAAGHAEHDPLLVAAYAAGDATGAQLDEAAGLVATCHACAALHHDLRAIVLALPATAAAAPSPRPRDFRLTAEQAASLRPAGWRRLLAPLAGPSFAFARPLGTGLATIGLAGILVAGASGIPLGGGAAAAPAGDQDAQQEKVLMTAGGDPSMEAVEMPAAADASGDPVAVPMAVPQPATEPGVAGGAGSGGAASSQAAGAYGNTGGPGEGTLEGANAGATDGVAPEGQPVARAAIPDEDASDRSSGSSVPVVALASLIALVAGLALVGLRYAGTRAQRTA
jgi:hypothetical protein